MINFEAFFPKTVTILFSWFKAFFEDCYRWPFMSNNSDFSSFSIQGILNRIYKTFSNFFIKGIVKIYYVFIILKFKVSCR